MGQVKNTVQFHVNDGDVQVAERIWRRGERNQNTVDLEVDTDRSRFH